MLRSRADWGGQDFRDVEAGVDSLIRAGLADPRRLGVFGRSYGGYLTSWTITQTQRYDAAVAIALIVDLASLYGQSDIQQYRAFEFQGRPWETPELWRRSSPMTHIAQVKTPTLIVDFEEDRRTPIAQAYELYRALLGLGVPTEFVRYPREPHVPREYRHRADMFRRMAAWFDRWVR
jgi:dipeptidyl aminopeptidase/acylaminoacyl peptidase